MIELKKKLFLSAVVFFINQNCFSQAFRTHYFGLVNLVKTTETGINPLLYTGLGYEHNLGNRIALSFEYNISYSAIIKDEIFFSDQNTQYASIKSGSNYYRYGYTTKHSMHEIGYQSKYFFRVNSGHSWYVSTGISMLLINYNWEINSSLNQNNVALPSDFKTGKFSEPVTYLPFTLRFGFRGPIDGSYGDYSFGLKANLSGDKTPTEKSYQYAGNSSLIDVGFFLCASWGFGWAKKL